MRMSCYKNTCISQNNPNIPCFFFMLYFFFLPIRSFGNSDKMEDDSPLSSSPVYPDNSIDLVPAGSENKIIFIYFGGEYEIIRLLSNIQSILYSHP